MKQMLFDDFNWHIDLRVSMLLGIKGEGKLVVEPRKNRCLEGRETEGEKEIQVMGLRG